MSSQQLGGRTDDRPWGRTFAGFCQTKLSGQIEVVDGERTFVVAFAGGTVVAARSPLATDAAVRVARLANLISPMQVSSFVQKHGTAPLGDDVDLLVAHAKLSAEQAIELHRKVTAHRAARTFSIESAGVTVEPVTIEVVPGCELDSRAIIYQGARTNLTERRLISELARMGSWFQIKPDVDTDAYGFGAGEHSLLDRLKLGGSLAELEACAPGLDARMVRGVLYALCATDACDVRPTAPGALVAIAAAADAPKELSAPRAEIVDLPAPKVKRGVLARVEGADLLAPRPDRDRSDTILDAPNRIDLVGVTIDGRYVVDQKLGEGAMGAVYLSHHTKLDRLFAVKVLHRRLLGSEKSRRRFEREAELTSRLSHHNVAHVVDVGVVEGLPYLAMEFVEGISLGTILVDAPLPQARAFALLRQLCAGLQHAHDAGLIHRDLKPSNVIIDSSGTEELLRIVDFGIAILNEPSSEERLTTRGVVLGSPDYMAPELALGTAIDHRLDLYALGVIAYEMFSGVRPFVGDGVDIALAHVNRPIPAMRDRAPAVVVDPLVEALVKKLLEKSPSARPADANAVRRLLDLIESDRPTAERELGLVVPAVIEPPVAPVDDRSAIKTRAMWQLDRPADEPIAPPVDDRSPIKTRAMWQLKREGDEPTGAPPVPVAMAPVAMAPVAMAPVTVPVATPERRDDDGFATDEIRPVRSRNRMIWIAVAVGILVFVVILVVRSRSSSEETMTPPTVAPATPVETPRTVKPTTPVETPRTVKPAPPAPPTDQQTESGSAATPPARPDTSAQAITALYRTVGTELARLQRAVGTSLTADLSRRYRMLLLASALQSAPRRAAAHEVLAQLRRDIKALQDAGR